MNSMTLLQRLADPLLLAVLAGMAAYGFRHGVFLAILAAFQVLAAGVAAIGLLDWMSEIVTLAGCPAAWCSSVAYAIVFLGTIVAIRLAIGSAVREDVVRFSPATDSAVGGLVGLLAGVLLCGGILVAWTMAPVSATYRINPSDIRLDMGPKLLAAFTRLAASDPTVRSILLSGEKAIPYVPPEPEEDDSSDASDSPARPEATSAEEPGNGPKDERPPAPPLVGEPFADDNGNGRFDADEPFLDIDRSGGYSDAMTFTDANGNGRRDIGLLERYRIGRGDWNRVIVVPPALLSAEEPARSAEEPAPSEPVTPQP